ncbi:hypothetical protein Tco_0554197 [Tanacetum coccineum]
MTNDQANYYSGITSITVNGKNAYELKGKFLDDLHKNAFSGTNGEDAVEHIEYFLQIVDPIDLPNVNHDKLRVAVFPISLVGHAWKWFDEIKGSIDNVQSSLPVAGEKMDIVMEETYPKPTYYKGWKRWDRYKITNHDQDERKNVMEHEEEERCEVFNDHKRPVCNIRRFELIKYSFRQDKEYVAVKEDEYEDLMNTSKDACQAYQEIFRMMDEGWTDLAAKKSMKLVKYLQYGNLELLES